MSKLKILLILISLNILLTSCQGLGEVGDVLRNEKKSSTDEFLIKKREPLSQPPDYDKLPTPGEMTKKNQEKNIKSILNLPEEKFSKTKSKSSSTEDSIIRQIK